MSRDLDSDFVTEKNKVENIPIFLYELSYTASDVLYFAESDGDIVFDGQTYTAFPLTHDAIEENILGEVGSLKVSVANVSRVMQAYLETYDGFRGHSVVVKIVWSGLLAMMDAYIADTFYIDSVVATVEAVEFTLVTKLDLMQVELPARKFNRNFCSWIFRSDECGYTGTGDVCNRTFQRCKELENQLRFGGFPAVPDRRVYIS